MSKDIVIQQSGEPTTLSNISRIETPKYGGGSVGWIEEDYIITNKKEITKNGTYTASSDNLYGYDKVIVKVPQKGKKKTGKRPQSSGDPNDYAVTAEDDGQGGQNLVYTKLPSSINIVNPPSKTVYSDGELIKKQGMLVKAYFADGDLWGDVPLGEIKLEPANASAQGGGSASIPSYNPASSAWELEHPEYFSFPITLGGSEGTISQTTSGVLYNETYKAVGAGNIYSFTSISSNTYFEPVFVSDKTFTATFTFKGEPYNINVGAVTIDGNTYYVSPVRGITWQSTSFPVNNVSQMFTVTDVVKLVFNGNKQPKHGCDVTALWNRPEDDKTLTDKFFVTVTSN